GQVFDEDSGNRQLVLPAQMFGALFVPLVNRLVRQREERERGYDGIDVAGPEFLEKDTRNFRLNGGGLSKGVLSAKRNLWGEPAAGGGALHAQGGGARAPWFSFCRRFRPREVGPPGGGCAPRH